MILKFCFDQPSCHFLKRGWSKFGVVTYADLGFIYGTVKFEITLRH